MIRVLLADDDALVRAGLRLMLRGAAGVEVVAEVADGAAVAGAVRDSAPDVVLMDIRMPVMDGIAATQELTAAVGAGPAARGGPDGSGSAPDEGPGTDPDAPPGPGPRVIVLTTFDSDGLVVRAMRAGAAGYLLKHTDPEEIVEAVYRAARGEPVLSPSAARALIDHAAAGGGADVRTAEAARRLALLSPRERETADAVAQGLSNAEIAERLFLSVGTVKATVSSALARLELDNRIQLALLAHDARRAGDGAGPEPAPSGRP
ncbi:response regulator transcription factor [Streptomyces sp. C11-1]|uniref:Response regulator transcription factor n=1 Tax=Streptomyces durocortorensis TaxID=2811104 RepID=A0ABY9W378_9ACTN|nr:response regulator transcription factor [Streptomyces durocortorensis]WNF30605.1 response regulator transcription factor [Streptomyces durocortorensis]